MKLLMRVLKRNDKLNIDNATLSYDSIADKLQEESDEVIQALREYKEKRTEIKLRELIGEIFDVIQICILLLWRCHGIAFYKFQSDSMIQEENIKHKDKLISERGWQPLTDIEIDIKE